MVKESVFKDLEKEYGKVSSWAIWADSEPNRPASNVADLRVFEDPKLLKILNTKYILVGLNAAIDEQDKYWRAFHSLRSHQNDYKVRYALLDTPIWGSYITDAIKDCPNVKSREVMREYRRNKELQDISKEKFKNELEIIGGKPTLIVFGNDALKVVNNMKIESYVKKIIKIQHYSCYIGKEAYKEKILNILNEHGIKEK